MTGLGPFRRRALRNVLAAALALLVAMPAEAGQWLARGSAVLGVGYALKRNLGDGVDLMGEAFEAAIKGDVKRVREIGNEIEALPGRLVRDAFPVLGLAGKARDAAAAAGRKLKSAVRGLPRLGADAVGAASASKERLRSVALKVRRYYGDDEEGEADPYAALAEEEDRAAAGTKPLDRKALAALPVATASGGGEKAGTAAPDRAGEDRTASAQDADPWAPDESDAPRSVWDAEPAASGAQAEPAGEEGAAEADAPEAQSGYAAALAALVGKQAPAGSGASASAPAADGKAERARIQAALAAQGYDPGPADGVFGPRTRAAVAAWQKAQGLRPTGELDAASAQALLKEAPRPAAGAAAKPAKAAGGPRAGEAFRDCAECPEMVVVPAGSFIMGSPASERGRDDYEGPQHRVTISQPFAVGKYEVTFEEWDACVRGGGCSHRSDYRGRGRGRRPVINVSWDDAQAYVSWLSRRTGRQYRLLSEAEWEYAARAGTRTRFHWGDSIGRNRANCIGCGSRWSRRGDARAAPVGSFPANGFGLHDMHGNVWEWVEDCWHDSYLGAPSDGSAWTTGCDDRNDSRKPVLRSSSWNNYPESVRSAVRARYRLGDHGFDMGFRVAQTLAP